MAFIQVRPSGLEAAGTTDPERTAGSGPGGIFVGLDAEKYFPMIGWRAPLATPPGSGRRTIPTLTAPNTASAIAGASPTVFREW